MSTFSDSHQCSGYHIELNDQYSHRTDYCAIATSAPLTAQLRRPPINDDVARAALAAVGRESAADDSVEFATPQCLVGRRSVGEHAAVVVHTAVVVVVDHHLATRGNQRKCYCFTY